MKPLTATFLSNGTEVLVEEYIRIGAALGEAAFYNENTKYNKLYVRRMQIEKELRGRPGDHRRYLLALHVHPNLEVRLNAASATFALAQLESRRTIEAIAATKDMPYAADAGMSLVALDRGIWNPE